MTQNFEHYLSDLSISINNVDSPVRYRVLLAFTWAAQRNTALSAPSGFFRSSLHVCATATYQCRIGWSAKRCLIIAISVAVNLHSAGAYSLFSATSVKTIDAQTKKRLRLNRLSHLFQCQIASPNKMQLVDE